MSADDEDPFRRVRLDKLENETPDNDAQAVLAAAHAYQIGAARDELPLKFHVERNLLARMPNLLVVSSSGAGFATVNIKDCTDAGILVVNQTGGNAEAVATHVLAMLLTMSKQLIQANHALRSGTMHVRTLYIGSDVRGRTIGIMETIAVAAYAAGSFAIPVLAADQPAQLLVSSAILIGGPAGGRVLSIGK